MDLRSIDPEEEGVRCPRWRPAFRDGVERDVRRAPWTRVPRARSPGAREGAKDVREASGFAPAMRSPMRRVQKRTPPVQKRTPTCLQGRVSAWGAPGGDLRERIGTGFALSIRPKALH